MAIWSIIIIMIFVRFHNIIFYCHSLYYHVCIYIFITGVGNKSWFLVIFNITQLLGIQAPTETWKWCSKSQKNGTFTNTCCIWLYIYIRYRFYHWYDVCCHSHSLFELIGDHEFSWLFMIVHDFKIAINWEINVYILRQSQLKTSANTMATAPGIARPKRSRSWHRSGTSSPVYWENGGLVVHPGWRILFSTRIFHGITEGFEHCINRKLRIH